MRFTLVVKAETLTDEVEHEMVGEALDEKTLAAVYYSLEDKTGEEDTPYKNFRKFLETDKAKMDALDAKKADKERHNRKGKWLAEDDD